MQLCIQARQGSKHPSLDHCTRAAMPDAHAGIAAIKASMCNDPAITPSFKLSQSSLHSDPQTVIMIKALSVAWLLVGSLAAVLGAPADVPISFSTTVAPLAAAHNSSVMASVCAHMRPVHGDSLPMSTVSPFVIRVSQRTAAPGDTVQVKLFGTLSEEFRGVYVQGRHEDSPVGQFLAPGPDSPPVTLSDCPPGVQNAASYISRQPINEVTIDYVVPDVPSVVFKATFVKTFSTFWTGVSSEPILISRSKV